MKPLLLSALVLSLSFVGSSAQEPAPELSKLKSSYEGAVQRATLPITETYVKELTKLKDSYTRAAKLQEALAVEKELQNYSNVLAAQSSLPVTTQPGATPTVDAEVKIPANSPDGYRIGPVKAGDVITLQYVEGKWKAWGGIATSSPDEAREESGKEGQCRLVIAEASRNGVPGKILKVVPAETIGKPFIYKVATTRDDIVLRIAANSNAPSNPGQVTYKLKVVR